MSDSATAFAVGPIVSALAPYVVSVTVAFALWLVKVAVSQFTRLTGVQIDAAYQAQLERACATEAGKLVAGAADNLARASIPVGSPIVKAAADRILTAQHLQDALYATGATPERIAAIITGELGKLQAQMTAIPPPPGKALS